MAEESSALRKYMKKENIFDNDIERVLCEQGIKDPTTDFKAYTQKQWDDLWRQCVVERAKELKDQKAKVNMEKKMTKLEKYWRKESGVKKTSIAAKSKASEDDAKAPPDHSSKAESNDLLEKAAGLKKFLQKSDCFNMDILKVLSDHGVNKEEDISNIKTNMEWGQVTREVRVLQRGTLKDQAAKSRADKTLKKVEKIWRKQTGIKSTSIKKGGDDKKKEAAPKDKKNEELATKGKKLKSWMKKQGIWQGELYDALIGLDITDESMIKDLKEKKFDNMIREVRVQKFKEIKDQKARQAVDKLLVKFEKIWRKESGIKKTSIKKK